MALEISTLALVEELLKKCRQLSSQSDDIQIPVDEANAIITPSETDAVGDMDSNQIEVVEETEENQIEKEEEKKEEGADTTKCKTSKIRIVRKGDGTTKKSRVSRVNHTELKCPECEFHTMSVGSWIIHLSKCHSTTPLRAGLILRCECGIETYSVQHSLICKISKITVVRKADGTTKKPRVNHTELECPECEHRSTSVSGWIGHLRTSHSTNATRAGLILHCECGYESYSDRHSITCKISKITIVRKGDGTTKGTQVSRMNHMELECPECDFRTMSVASWVEHLYRFHSTTPTRAGLILRCECGNESLSCGHSRVCKISKITIVREEDRSTKEPRGSRRNYKELKCPECEFRTKSVGGWVVHLCKSHSTTPTQAGLILHCECGNESFSEHHSRKCEISKITVVRREDGTIKNPQAS